MNTPVQAAYFWSNLDLKSGVWLIYETISFGSLWMQGFGLYIWPLNISFNPFISAFLNPFPPISAALINFTLSNAKQFYSSMGNPLGSKGLRNYIPIMSIPLQTCLQCCLQMVNLKQIFAPCSKSWELTTRVSHSVTVNTCTANLFKELLNPLFSINFFFNQWFPYISINMVFTHSWHENTIIFQDGVIESQILITPGLCMCNLHKIAWLLSFTASQL